MFKKGDKKTLKPVKSQGTERRATLSNYTKRTLGSGNLRAAVRVPPDEDRDEWVRVFWETRVEKLEMIELEDVAALTGFKLYRLRPTRWTSVRDALSFGRLLSQEATTNAFLQPLRRQ